MSRENMFRNSIILNNLRVPSEGRYTRLALLRALIFPGGLSTQKHGERQ